MMANYLSLQESLEEKSCIIYNWRSFYWKDYFQGLIPSDILIYLVSCSMINTLSVSRIAGYVTFQGFIIQGYKHGRKIYTYRSYYISRCSYVSRCCRAFQNSQAPTDKNQSVSLSPKPTRMCTPSPLIPTELLKMLNNEKHSNLSKLFCFKIKNIWPHNC